MRGGEDDETNLVLTVEGPARRRSVEEKVLQFDEAGMRGVYGGVAVKVAGMLQVVANLYILNVVLSKIRNR